MITVQDRTDEHEQLLSVGDVLKAATQEDEELFLIIARVNPGVFVLIDLSDGNYYDIQVEGLDKIRQQLIQDFRTFQTVTATLIVE